MYDAIIVGARCGGAATAMLLARSGHRVLLVDRAAFPSDIPHGHFIHQRGPACLQRWGLLDRVVATNCRPIDAIVSDLGDFPLVGRNIAHEGRAMGYAPRRRVFDALLLEAAAESGAEIHQRFFVEGFTADGDRITGIRGRDVGSGAVSTEDATVTIGADGRNSMLARTVRAPRYHEAPTLTSYCFSYWSGVQDPTVGIYRRPASTIFTFPTNDDLHAVFVCWPIERLTEVRSDIERHVYEAVDQTPELSARLRAGRREERWYGAADLPNFYRKPHGPGWALVGDAGCHKDPYLALGISDALRDAEILAEALSGAFAGVESTDLALQRYEQRRNAESIEQYELNLHLAANKPLPEDLAQLRLALRGDAAATRRFFMANQGLIPREEFFNEQNLRSLKEASRPRVALAL